MSLTFDSEPILGFFLGEASAKPMINILQRVIDNDITAYLNIVNLAEVYYILHRINPKIVEQKIELLRNYGVNIIPVNDDALWQTAAEIKSSNRMSLADAFAVATAIVTKSTLVIGRDQEFNSISIEKIVLD